MFTPDQYELLDFGGGRKLERFGQLVLDRPSPPAEHDRVRSPELWAGADARFERAEGQQGQWIAAGRPLPESWTIRHDRFVLKLHLSPFGQVGVFPEQAANWDWIARRVGAADRPLRVLNLFAYTGGSTLAAAAAGAEVTHVDSAKNIVARARINAELSGLVEAPIRWIVEDAFQFVRREINRGQRYDAVILDPPSYGHGPRGQVWRLGTHLKYLLESCAALTAGCPAFLLLTCHTPGFGPSELKKRLGQVFPACDAARIVAAPLKISSSTGYALPSGFAAVWPWEFPDG